MTRATVPMSELVTGEEFQSEIVKILERSRNAAVKHKGEFITIGPVDCEEGTSVFAKYLGGDQHYGLCLTESVRHERYVEFVENILSTLITDEVPEPDETSIAEVEEVSETGLGTAKFGETEVELGPINAEPGDYIEVIGVSETAVKVVNPDHRGKNYTTRFSIITGNRDTLAAEVGDEFEIAITDVWGDQPMGAYRDVPIVFPEAEVAIGQVVKGKITGFGRDTAIGTVTEVTDEIRRIPNAGLWARIQWLTDAGFPTENTLQHFASEFIEVSPDRLPAEVEHLREALIAEGIRLAVSRKTSPEGDARVHVIALKHWVSHKLDDLLSDPDEEDGDDESGWFRDILDKPPGPRLTSLAELFELKGGFYAPTPTRAVMLNDSKAVLVSAHPTADLIDRGLNITIRGTTRRVINTSREELQAKDVTIQSRDQYLGTEQTDSFDESALQELISTRPIEPWNPGPDWLGYQGNITYQYDFDADPVVVTRDDTALSLWKTQPEFGAGNYWLKIDSDDSESKMISIPYNVSREVCLLIDQMAGDPREIQITEADNEIRISCGFKLPTTQVRWLQALDARFDEPKHGQTHWRLPADDHDAVLPVLSQLPIRIRTTQGTQAQ